MGHKAVKKALVARLKAGLPGWTDQKPWVARSDVLPADANRWPFVVVRTTKMQTSKWLTTTTAQYVYRCEVTCGTRSVNGDRDASFDEATDSRDDLIEAVRWTLRSSRDLGNGIEMTNGELIEETAPAIIEGAGSTVAMGTTTFMVSAQETVPPAAGVVPPETVTTVDLSVSGVDASQPI